MTLAHHDIEARLSEVVQEPAPRSRALIVARTASIGEALRAEMMQDAQVRGRVLQQTLVETMDDSELADGRVDFLVFEIDSDPQSDLDALRRLALRTARRPACIAVIGSPIDQKTRQSLSEAGVIEFVEFGVQEEPAAPPHAAPSVPPATDPTAETPLPDATPDLAPADTGPVAAQPVSQPDAVDDLPDDAEMSVTARTTTRKPRGITKGKLVVFLRARGGAGATTLAVNLAVAQAQRKTGGTVALVDLDIQNGAVSLALDLPDSAEASAWLRGAKRPSRDFIETAMAPHGSGVDVLTGPDVFAPLTAIDAEDIARLLDALKARYDHIVLDLPQAITEWTDPVLERADEALIVTDTSLPAIKRTRRLIDLIGEEHMTLPVRVVVNQQRKPVVRSSVLKECEALLGRTLEHWIPADPRAARRATDLGVPIQTGAKRSAVAKAIAKLAEAVFAQSAKPAR
ncbi:AAA family ATPase [Sulfitobacter sp. HNIBRBA3233]|uniref:AAA family ATPase n=1 Tax=Sulfitobacter marinivivus TaxID=3158558 RepID=UPI0032E03F8D